MSDIPLADGTPSWLWRYYDQWRAIVEPTDFLLFPKDTFRSLHNNTGCVGFAFASNLAPSTAVRTSYAGRLLMIVRDRVLSSHQTATSKPADSYRASSMLSQTNTDRSIAIGVARAAASGSSVRIALVSGPVARAPG